MKLRYLVLFPALLAACDHPLLGLCGSEQSDEQADQRRLAQMRAELEELVGQAKGNSMADCRYIGLGAKACGGPKEYLIYSVAQTDSGLLTAKVEAYNAFERRMNRRYGYISDCSIPPEPTLGLREGRCVDLDQETLPSEPILLQLVDSFEEVPRSDPFALQGLQLEGDILKATVGYSGGCQEHRFSLWATYGYQKSLPPRHPLRLIHQGGGDPCEAHVVQELLFDLRPLKALHPEQERILLILEEVEQPLEYAF